MISSIVASIRHQLKYSDDYFLEDDDVIYFVALNYLSMESADSLIPLSHDRVVDSFSVYMAANIKTLTVPTERTEEKSKRTFSTKVQHIPVRVKGVLKFWIDTYPL